MVGLLFFIIRMKEPVQLEFAITTTGISIGEVFTSVFLNCKISPLFIRPPIKILYVNFKSVFRPLVSISN